jgi:hypothetical protein
MVGKFVLPLLGSAPEVWPTTVLFFQAALLAGYAFAHLTSRLPPRRQALLQLVLLGVAAVVLPIGVRDQSPPESDSPVPSLRPVVPRFGHHESRRKGGLDACSRAEARARGVSFDVP